MKKRCTWALVGMSAVFNAQASCGGSACSINTNWDEHSVLKPGVSLDLRYSYSRADVLRSGSGRIAADTAFAGEVENLRTITRITTASLDYTRDEHWGVMINVPYVTRDHTHNLGPYTGATSAGYESFYAQSLGDIKAVARYRWTVDEASRSGVGVKLGLKLNTGRRDFTLNTGVRPNEVSLQPGNGSTDLIVGMFWNQAVPGAGLDWFAQGTLQTSIKSAAEYRPGRQVNLDLGTRYALGRSVSVLLQLNGQWNSADSGTAAAVSPVTGGPGSGGRSYSLTPGLMYAVAVNTNLYALMQWPFYQFVNGEQLTPGRSFTAGINHRF